MGLREQFWLKFILMAGLLLLLSALAFALYPSCSPVREACAEDQYRYSTSVSSEVKVEVYNGEQDYEILVKVLDSFDSVEFTPSQGNLTAAIVRNDGKKTMEVIREFSWNNSSSATLFAGEAGNYTIYGGVEQDDKIQFARLEYELLEPVENMVPVAVPVMASSKGNFSSGDTIKFYLSDDRYEDIIFNASASYDPDPEDNDSLEYWWTIFYNPHDYTIKKGELINWRFWDPGDYVVKLRVSDGKSPETDGGISYLNFTLLTTVKAELQYETIPALDPYEYEHGKTINLVFWVVNNGELNAGDFNISVHMVRLQPLARDLAQEFHVPGLAIMETWQVNVSINTGDFYVNRYDLELKLDWQNEVKEGNEGNNNITFKNITISRPPDTPYVALSLIDLSLEEGINEEIPLAGGEVGILSPVTVTARLENTGTGDAYWPEVKLFVDGYEVNSQQLDIVKAGEDRRVRFVWYSYINGTRNLTVQLHHQGENLGTKSIPLIIIPPELPDDDSGQEEGYWIKSNLDTIFLWSAVATLIIAVIVVVVNKYSEAEPGKVAPLMKDSKPGPYKTDSPAPLIPAKGAAPSSERGAEKKDTDGGGGGVNGSGQGPGEK